MVDVFDSIHVLHHHQHPIQDAGSMFGVYKQFTYCTVILGKKVLEQSGGAGSGLFSIVFATALMLSGQPEAFFLNEKALEEVS